MRSAPPADLQDDHDSFPAPRPAVITNPLRDPRDRRLPRVPEPCALVVFGITGDLARKKLMPAVYDLANRGLLPPGFALVGFGRRGWSDEEFARNVREAVQASARTPFREDVWQQLARLAGADHLHASGLGSKFYETDDEVAANVRSLLEPLGATTTPVPTLSSGQNVTTPGPTYAAVGSTDLLMLAGGGVAGHPDGPAAGVQSLRDAWAAAVASVLNLVSGSLEKELVEGFAARDAALADQIKNLMFVFEDLVALDDKSLQRLLREVDAKQLALALKAASRLRRKAYRARLLVLHARFEDDKSVWRTSAKLPATQDSFAVLAALDTLLPRLRAQEAVHRSGCRMIGVTLAGVSTALRLKNTASLMVPMYRFTRPGRACRVTALLARLTALMVPSARAMSA